jgi:hypothetical protein
VRAGDQVSAVNPRRATFRGVPLTDADLHPTDRRSTAPVTAPVGLRPTGRRTRAGVPVYRPDPAAGEWTPLPEDFTGSIRIGGPLPIVWVGLALFLVAVSVGLPVADRFGPKGFLVVIAAYIAANVVADRTVNR